MEKSKISNRCLTHCPARTQDAHVYMHERGGGRCGRVPVAWCWRIKAPLRRNLRQLLRLPPKIGCIPETLRVWVRQAKRNSGARDGATSAERDKVNRKVRAPAPNMLCPLVYTAYRLPGNRSATLPMSQNGGASFRSGAYAAPPGPRAPFTLRDRHLRQPHRRLA
jgi:hypothetical protein